MKELVLVVRDHTAGHTSDDPDIEVRSMVAPGEVIAALLRGLANELDPPKPVTRGPVTTFNTSTFGTAGVPDGGH